MAIDNRPASIERFEIFAAIAAVLGLISSVGGEMALPVTAAVLQTILMLAISRRRIGAARVIWSAWFAFGLLLVLLGGALAFNGEIGLPPISAAAWIAGLVTGCLKVAAFVVLWSPSATGWLAGKSA